jgi:high mobility group protein B2
MAPKQAKKADAKAAKADKPKVKRAPSPYIIFCSEKRPGIKISHPDATFGETGKMLGQMWAAVDDKTKAVGFLKRLYLFFA